MCDVLLCKIYVRVSIDIFKYHDCLAHEVYEGARGGKVMPVGVEGSEGYIIIVGN